jgi:nucleotide-binding universal stress UspA family protein
VSRRTLIVPLDGSAHALVALPIAKRLAELDGALIHLLHVSQELAPPADVLASIGLSGIELRGSVLDTRAGDPASGIIQQAIELGSELIVMCTHTAVAAGDTPLGRTALAVVKGAPCPLVLVRPERGVVPWTLHRILLPHDGTPTTSAAIGLAAELARHADAELAVLHVAGPARGAPSERGSLAVPRYLDQPQHEWPAWIGEFVERLGSVVPLESLKVRMCLAHGEPGSEVLRSATEQVSDLIVLAWHSVWEGAHAATVKTVLHDAPCPVMIIRARE